MAAVEGKKEVLVAALNKLATALEKQVEDTRKSYDPSRLDQFFCGDSKEAGVYGVYPVQHYYECLSAVGVKTRKELEEVWVRFYKDEAVRESVEGLLTAEDNWRAFIRYMDAGLQKIESERSPVATSTLGSQLPQDLCLTEAVSGDSVAVETILKESRYTLFILRKHYV